MSRDFSLATFNCENLFTRPAVFEESDRRSSELLADISLLKTELKRPVFDHAAIRRLTAGLAGYASVCNLRGSAATAKGAADWLGYVQVEKATLSDAAVRNVARVIADADATVTCLIEVEDRITLQGFHDDILAPEFLRPAGKEPYPHVVSVQGNDGRGINIGVLSRVPVRWMRSHAGDRTAKGTPVFSRDCLEVNLDLPGDRPLHLLVNHFKSMGYSSPGDPQGNRRRLVQAETVAGLLADHDLAAEYVAVAGDFNAPPASPSLAPLLTHPGLYNVNEALPEGSRGTYRSGRDQLDYLLVSRALKARLRSVRTERRGIYTARGIRYPTVGSRRTEASDHAAVVAEFS
jgi:endonuclease/exonuclease/phosphatase family metal-dependent hydrolase